MTTDFRVLLAIVALSASLTASSVAARAGEPPQNRQQWTAAIREAFAARKPRIETIRGVTGTLRPELTITIQPDGSVSDVIVKRPSGFQGADDAAVEMVRSAGRLPAFAPDMPKEALTFALPVNFSFAPQDEENSRLFVDTVDGVRLEVPKPLFVRPVANDPAYDALAEVVVGEEAPSYAVAGEPLCVVGFKKAVGALKAAQSELNAPDRVESARERLVRQSSEKGLDVERSDVTDYRSTKLIELLLRPKPEAASSLQRYYQSSFEVPDGGVAIFCGSDEKNMPAALEAFRSIRDGASVMPR